MRVVHIATNDIMGGAARAAYRIHSGLRRLGHESLMYVQFRASDDPNVIRFRPAMGLLARLSRRLRENRIAKDWSRFSAARPNGYDVFTDDRAPYGSDWFTQLPAADLINLHWVGGFVDYKRFFARAPAAVPIVWRLADMNPFTGGCHFDHECGRFMSGCGECPQLASTDPQDLSHAIWHRKHGAFRSDRKPRLHLVVLNQLMVKTIERSPIFGGFPVTVIPNGLDTEVFAPRDRRAAREVLGVPVDARVVLFAADHLQNRRKGLEFVTKALSQLQDIHNLFLLSIGGGRPELTPGIAHRHLGRVQDDLLLSIIYSAADVFVFPSLQETFGQTALESMACGTPVVGFDGVGGVPDLIQDGATGRRVPLRDVAGLVQAIQELLKDPSMLVKMSKNCRRLVVERFNLHIQAERFAELYRSLLEKN